LVYSGGTVGVAAYSQTAQTVSLTTNAATVSVWIKQTSIPAAINRWVSIIGGATGEAFVIRHQGSAAVGQLHLYGATTVGGTTALRTAFTVNSQVVANEYANFVGTWDGTTAAARLYKNGVEVGNSVNVSTASSGWGSVAQAPVLSAGSCTFRLSSPDEVMQGNIYQAALYNRALSASEVYQNYIALQTRLDLWR
jgi:hypothetical protein